MDPTIVIPANEGRHREVAYVKFPKEALLYSAFPHAHYVCDNSRRNPSNPDPTIQVSWGEQSFQEMLFTSLRYRWVDETNAHRVNYETDLRKGALMGMMDDNLDGKLRKAELKGQMGGMIAKYFDVLDKNKDGVLDDSEMAAAQAMMGNRRRADTAPVSPPAPGGK